MTNVNEVPKVTNAIADQNWNGIGIKTLQIPTNTFADPDHDTLTYSALNLPAWLTFNPTTHTFTGVTEYGNYSLNLTVTANDGHGATVSDTFVLNVSNPLPYVPPPPPPPPRPPVEPPRPPVEPPRPRVESPPPSQEVHGDVQHLASGETLVTFKPSAEFLSMAATPGAKMTMEGGAALPAWIKFDAATGTFTATPKNGEDPGAINLTSQTVVQNHF